MQQFASDHVLFVAFWGATVDCAGSTMLIRPFAPRAPFWILHWLLELGLIVIIGGSATLWASGIVRLFMILAVAVIAQLSTYVFDPYSRAAGDRIFDFLLRVALFIVLVTLMLYQMPSFPTGMACAGMVCPSAVASNETLVPAELAEVILVPLLFAVLFYSVQQLGLFTAIQRQYALFCDAVKVSCESDALAVPCTLPAQNHDLGFPRVGLVGRHGVSAPR